VQGRNSGRAEAKLLKAELLRIIYKAETEKTEDLTQQNADCSLRFPPVNDLLEKKQLALLGGGRSGGCWRQAHHVGYLVPL